MEGLVHVLIHDGNPEGARQSVEGRTCGTVGLKWTEMDHQSGESTEKKMIWHVLYQVNQK